MKRTLQCALLALALPTVALATTVSSRGDIVRGSSPVAVAADADFALTGSFATMALDTGSLHLTASAEPQPDPALQALFLLIPAPPPDPAAENMPLRIAKATVDMPEPGSLGLLGVGLIGLAGIVRWRLRGVNPGGPNAARALGEEGGDTTRASTGWATPAPAPSEASGRVMPPSTGTHPGEELTCAQ